MSFSRVVGAAENEMTAHRQITGLSCSLMGLRYRKSINLGGGFKLNLNSQSISVSGGARGARVTYNSKGYLTTSVGLPGTGLSYRTTQKIAASPATRPPAGPYRDPSSAEARRLLAWHQAAWITWHQAWLDQILAHYADKVLPWVKAHPHKEQRAIQQFEAACREWVKAASIAAVGIPGLREYAAGCEKRVDKIIWVPTSYTKEEVITHLADAGRGTPELLAQLDDDDLRDLFCETTGTHRVL
jgi:hypothetical protein